MKKIIIFLSVVCLITTMFTISTFAAEPNTIQAGIWKAVNVPTFDGFTPIDVHFTTVNGVECVGMKMKNDNLASDFLYVKSDGSTMASFYGGPKLWVSNNYQTITIWEDTAVTASQFEWFTANYSFVEALPEVVPPPTECDGTVCPLSDPNLDNVCDECGLPVTFSLRSSMLDYARSEIDRALSGAVSSGQYWLIFDRTSDTNTGQKVYYSYISAEPFYENDGKLYAGSTGTALVHRQMITENADGTFSASGWSSSQTGNIPVNLSLIIDSSHDKSFFFQMPLWEIVQEAGQAEMKAKTLKSVGEVMLVLTIAGVSLIALLVGLILLSKKLSSFLPR